MKGGYSKWSESLGAEVITLRSRGMNYKTICKNLRKRKLTVYDCDITHWRKNKGFTVWGSEFGKVIKDVEDTLCHRYNDQMVKLTKKAITNRDMNPHAVSNWMKAMIHRMAWVDRGKTIRLFDDDGDTVETIVYRMPQSKAMGDKLSDKEE